MRMLDACDSGFGLGVMFTITRTMSPLRALSSAAYLRRTEISAITEACAPRPLRWERCEAFKTRHGPQTSPEVEAKSTIGRATL